MIGNKLGDLRQQIDTIDKKILKLISNRAHCAQEVAKIKQKACEESGEPVVFYKPEREAQVLRAIMKNNEGPLADEEIARLFREIMSACLSLEMPLKVAYLGPDGTFTKQAAIKHFGHSAHCVPMAAIDAVFREVSAGAANYGVVPVENSSEGVVNHTLDSFIDSSLKICGEVVLRIHHHMLISENTNKENITRIYSHSQSLAQCRKWLDSNWPTAERIAVSSNAEAAKRVHAELNSAAIAGDMAIELYHLEKIAEKIEDQPDNSTRFLIIGNDQVPCSSTNGQDDTTSIIVGVKNQPGALQSILQPFHDHNIDLTRVETRPAHRGIWNYLFFIDFNGHQDESVAKAILKNLSEHANDLKILGSYPKGVL